MNMKTMREELEKILKDHIYQNNSKWASHNAKQFMDWTGVGYDDILEDNDIDPEEADYYDIMVSHRLPSLSDGEIEATYTNIYNGRFQNEGYYDHDRNYDALVENNKGAL